MLNDEANLLPQKGYWLLDANIYYRLDNGLTLSAYSRNITNTKYSSWGSTLGALGQNLFPGDPRTYGLRMTAERSDEHTSELQSLMRISYAVFRLKKKNTIHHTSIKTKP